jgi:hypothetical protein
VLITLAASHDLLIHQMDVKTAFHNGELDEEIYMMQPEGFVTHGQENKVCRLRNPYIASSRRQSNGMRSSISAVFVVNEADTCVYYQFVGGKGVILCLYVDGILIFGTSIDVINDVKSFLSQNFDIKGLGEADVILNIKLIKGENGIILKQSHYVENILNRFGFFDSKDSPTPFDPSLKLCKNRGQGINQLRYSQIIGSLKYLAGATRPDISFVVSKLNRITFNPGSDHWCALERVMRYLRGTSVYGLHYTRYPAVLEGYSDSNRILDAAEIKATSGYIFTIGGAAVSWRSHK